MVGLKESLQNGLLLCRVGNHTLTESINQSIREGKKGKVVPYSLQSIGPRADPDVQAISHPPSYRLPLLSARPAVTSVAFIGWRYPYMVAHIWYRLTTFIDPKRMKGWVGLVGWPVMDSLPTTVVTISCRSSARLGKFAGQRPTSYHCATQPTQSEKRNL